MSRTYKSEVFHAITEAIQSTASRELASSEVGYSDFPVLDPLNPSPFPLSTFRVSIRVVNLSHPLVGTR